MRVIFAILMTIVLIMVGVNLIIKNQSWNKEVENWLKLAADAPNIERAEKFLDRAIAGINERGIVGGNSALIFHNPNADVGIWLGQITAAKQLLVNLREQKVSGLEETNALMKFRETLLDVGEKGTVVTSPPHMSTFPNQMLWAWLLWLSLGVCICMWIWILVDTDNI